MLGEVARSCAVVAACHEAPDPLELARDTGLPPDRLQIVTLHSLMPAPAPGR